MIRSFFIILLLSISSLANIENNSSIENNETNQTVTKNVKLENVLYLNYKELPSRVIKGEVFSIKIKALSTIEDFTDIRYELSPLQGLKLLSSFPVRQESGKYYYESFYFLVTSKDAKLPDITGTLITTKDIRYKKTTLKAKGLDVVTLNPTDDFSNIIARSFELIEYKTTSYDNEHNIVLFAATARQCDISAFKLQRVYKQGVESIVKSYFDSKITYYAIINKRIQNFSFSYFNTLKNRFLTINIPIIVDDDSVSTQSDLKPKDQSKIRLKMIISAGVALFGFLIILWRKRYIYLIFIIFPLSYLIYLGSPSKEVCIKQGSNITLLPISNSTIFEVTPSRYYLQKEGSIKNFTKVKLKNSKIGWVKDEDICSY